jgi:CRISPR-associated protein Csm3
MAQLKKKIIFKGKIVALTGLHIGGTNSSMSIGGPDKSVIRNPLTNRPYIPGSSLKGKMRSLVELNEGTIGQGFRNTNIDAGPTDEHTTIAAQLFGTARGDKDQRPSRVIVRDGSLLSKEEDFQNTDLPYTESKTEVVIDRITSAANPRQIERVPAGAEFALNVVLNIFENDNEERLRSYTIKALQLVQDDYLGGNGSRGSGQVCFSIEKVIERTAAYYRGEKEEMNITDQVGLPDDMKQPQTES